jgi:prophage tail gpP-like protein
MPDGPRLVSVDGQTQREYPGANPNEIATLVVNGMYFSDWETVFVQHRWPDPEMTFRFTCAERDPVPELWSRLQFRPGDKCQIYLAGRLAFNGYILIRQVAYEANSHGVSLQGKSLPWELTGSILPDEGSGGNFSGDLTSIVTQVLAPTNVRLGEIVGTVDGTPFKPPVHFNQGETRWAFLERLARDRNVDLATNPQGNLVLVGPHGPRMSAVLIEGENIKSAQVVIDGQDKYNYLVVSGQRQPDDQTNGPAASEMRSKAVPPGPFTDFRTLLVPIEHPVWTQHEVDLRAQKEARWSGEKIDADVVVYGWLDPSGNLWKVGTEVQFESPMVPMHQPMTLVVATFQQDSVGATRTSLHLWDTWRTNASGGFATDPPTAKADTGPVTAPPDGKPPDPPPEYLPGFTPVL